MKNKKPKKTRNPPKSFAQRLYEELRDSGLGQATIGRLSDASGKECYVGIKQRDISFEVVFDEHGKIEWFGIWKDVWELTGTEDLAIFKPEKS